LVHHTLDAPEQWAIAVLVGLVLLRQMVTVAENRDLARRLAASEADLRRRATHDDLTGLPNRALLLERLHGATTPGPSGIMLVDLDGFKQVNDAWGHETGDALLIEVARRLREGIRETDTAARIGGDEFVVVLSAQADVVNEVAGRLLTSLGAPYVIGEVVVQDVGASVGVAILQASRDAVASERALRDADHAMYVAKRSGGHRIETSLNVASESGGRNAAAS
jgi:diguanylate cyclase (GGDEF)-like protein